MHFKDLCRLTYEREFWGGHAVLALAAFLTAPALFADVVETLNIAFDRENCVYQVGEEASFSVKALDASGQPADSGVMTVKITNDGRDVLSEETLDLSKKAEATFQCALEAPGARIWLNETRLFFERFGSSACSSQA